jgi:hypothetical protein
MIAADWYYFLSLLPLKLLPNFVFCFETLKLIHCF